MTAIEPVSTDPLVFVCGMFRSGSTLLEQILAAHPALASGGEFDFFQRRLSAYPDAMLSLDAAAAAQLGADYRAELAASFGAGVRVIDKRPDNILYLGLIKALFPNARILVTQRQPLDVSLSVFFQSLDASQPYANDLFDIAHYYSQQQRLLQHWQQLLGENILTVNYESLVNTPREEIGRALAFLGLDWEENCLSFHETTERVRTASLHQVRRPLYQASAGRWSNYAAHIAKLRDLLS